MDSCREGRRIGKIQRVEGVQREACGNARHSDVHHFIHCARAQHLNAQQPARGLICHQLCHKGSRAGVVVRLVVRHAHSGLHVIALLPGLCFRQARAAHVQIL